MKTAKPLISLLLCAVMILTGFISVFPISASYECTTSTPTPVKFDLGKSESLSYFNNPSNIVCYFNDSEKSIQLATTGGADPHVTFNLNGISADDYKYVAITYRSPVSNSGASGNTQFFFLANGIVASEQRSLRYNFTKSYTYNTEIIDLSSASYWNGTANAIRIDPFEFGNVVAWDTIYIHSISLYSSKEEALADVEGLNAEADGVLADVENLEELASLRTYNVDTYTTPIWEGNVVYHESCLPVLNANGTMSPISLLYDIDKVVSVRNSALNIEYKYGRDYTVSNGKLIINTKAQGGQINTIPYSKIYQNPPTQSCYYFAQSLNTYIFCKDLEFYQISQIAVTYTHKTENKLFVPTSKTDTLDRAVAKFENNEPMNIVFCGDSVTYGCNCSSYIGVAPYCPRWSEMTVDALAKYYNNSNLTHINTAIGGKMSDWGYATVQENVINYNPDLVILGLGCNDISMQVSPQQYYNNMKGMVDKIKAACPDCDIILIATLTLNPLLQPDRVPYFTQYQDLLWDIALNTDHVAVVDITSVHRSLQNYKRYIDITENNINHINDFMSRIYAQALKVTLTGTPEKDVAPVNKFVSADTIYASDNATRIVKNGGNDANGTYIGTTTDTGMYAFGWLACTKRVKAFGYRYGDQTVINSAKYYTDFAVTTAGFPVSGLTGTTTRFRIYIPINDEYNEVTAVAELYDGTIIDVWKITYDVPGKIAPVELKYRVSADQIWAADGVTDLAKRGGNDTAGTQINATAQNTITTYGWLACSYKIAKFGYRYGDNIVLNSAPFATEAAVIAAGAPIAGSTGASSRFRITIPIDVNSNEVYAIAQLADGTVIDLWRITYSAKPAPAEEAKLLNSSFNTVKLDNTALCDVAVASDWLNKNPISINPGTYRTITLRGWAYCNKPIAGFGYLIDDEELITGNFIEVRNDVKTVISKSAEGFKVNADISNLIPGNHEVKVVVITKDGSTFTVATVPVRINSSTQTVTLKSRSFDQCALDNVTLCNNGKVEEWVAAHPLTFPRGRYNAFVLTGWSLLSSNIACYGYKIDGGATVKGNYFMSRPDVKRIIGLSAEGYQVSVPLAGIGAGAHTINIMAIASDGTEIVVGTVNFKLN